MLYSADSEFCSQVGLAHPDFQHSEIRRYDLSSDNYKEALLRGLGV